jgi:hypothetical protein
MNKNNLISFVLIIIISVFIGIGHYFTPICNSISQEKADEFKAQFDLEEFILNNEPGEHDISDFPITEAFQYTSNIEKVYNKWELIRGDLANAKLKNKEAALVARKQRKLLKEDKAETDAIISSVTTGNSKDNSAGVFTELQRQRDTGAVYLKQLNRDLGALENEAELGKGNAAASAKILTGS